MEERIKESGYVEEKPVESLLSATVKFNLSDQLATKIASNIKIEYIPGTAYIGLRTYSQIVEGTYDLIKE